MSNYEKYKYMIDGDLPSCKEILTVFGSDLNAIDESILFNKLDPIEKVEKENKRLKELAILCKDKSYSHPEWSKLSGRVRTLYIYRNTPKTFKQASREMNSILGESYYNFCIKYGDILDSMINRSLDFEYEIFGVETLLRSYLARVKDENGFNKLVETCQYKNMRLAVFLWYEEISVISDKISDEIILKNVLSKIETTYKDISLGYISHASPTQFNAGMKKPQLASCFLLSVDDSLDSLSKGWHDIAFISKATGGVGKTFDEIRHSEIGNHGWSKGIVPWIKIDNEVMATVDQFGKRRGSQTTNLTDWHIDIYEFIDLKRPDGKEELRARDLFYSLMISDLFMKRVENNEMWTLFCPAKTNGLAKTFGQEFEKKYIDLEAKVVSGLLKSGFRRVHARELWAHIMRSQIATGMPFILYKDSINRKSNQSNLGTIRTSNLCVEIAEYVDKDNIASCNLSSIPISKFVKFNKEKPYFDFELLGEITRKVIRNMNQVIDRNYYLPEVPEIKYTNFRNRPLGIGLQDLAGCFALMDYAWDSYEAKVLNEKIARVMYYHGIDESCKMAEETSYYETFPGSPSSKGLFQFDLWTLERIEKDCVNKGIVFNKELEIEKLLLSEDFPCKEFNWKLLRQRMMKYGLKNSLLFAQMPTASTAQIMGNNESIECYTQLLYSRTVLSGQFIVCVPHLVRDLEKIGLWNDKMLKHLFLNQGSIQTFPEDDIKDMRVVLRLRFLKDKYKTVYEHRQKLFATLYLDRAKYQCQTSSNNAFIKQPNLKKLNAYHFYMWKGGAKTGMYYLRQQLKPQALDFCGDIIKTGNRKKELVVNDEECLVCGS